MNQENKDLSRKLLFILGATLPIIIEHDKKHPNDICEWILKAIEEVVYNGGDLPRMG